MKEGLQIGEVAKRAGVSIDTLRLLRAGEASATRGTFNGAFEDSIVWDIVAVYQPGKLWEQAPP